MLLPKLDGRGHQLLALFGGRKVSALRVGETIDLNTCIERISLKQRRQPPGLLTSLLVLVERDNQHAVNDLTMRVYQSFPRGMYAECSFIAAATARGRVPAMVLIFSPLRRDRRVYEWIARLPAGVSAFYPMAGSPENVFYCRWGYRHPLASLTRLFDPEDARYVFVDLPSEGGWTKIKRQDALKGLRAARQVFAVGYDASIPPG